MGLLGRIRPNRDFKVVKPRERIRAVAGRTGDFTRTLLKEDAPEQKRGNANGGFTPTEEIFLLTSTKSTLLHYLCCRLKF